jgi:hypothetical protein
MEDAMQKDDDVRRRLYRLENSCKPPKSSSLPIDDDYSTIRELDLDSTLEISLGNKSNLPYPGVDIAQNPVAFHRSFEKLLESSRAYRRASHSECDVSFSSSNIRSHAWSALSGVSLADISIISVIALPLESDEISKLLLNSSNAAALPASLSPALSASYVVTESFHIRKIRKINRRTARRLTAKSKDSSKWSPER